MWGEPATHAPHRRQVEAHSSSSQQHTYTATSLSLTSLSPRSHAACASVRRPTLPRPCYPVAHATPHIPPHTLPSSTPHPLLHIFTSERSPLRPSLHLPQVPPPTPCPCYPVAHAYDTAQRPPHTLTIVLAPPPPPPPLAPPPPSTFLHVRPRSSTLPPFHPQRPQRARAHANVLSRARVVSAPSAAPPIPLLAPTIPPAASLPDPPQLHEKKSFTRACTLWLKPRACVRSSRPLRRSYARLVPWPSAVGVVLESMSP